MPLATSLDLPPYDNSHIPEKYLKLLEEKHREQVYQTFIEENSALIPREFMQNHGIYDRAVFRKLKFGTEYVSDFVFLAKSSLDCNVVLIEIEKPHSKFFKNNTLEPHSDFNKALSQITSWRDWLNESKNQSYFLKTSLGGFGPHHLVDRFQFKFVLVMGRRVDFSSQPKKRNRIKAYEQEDFKIISFDSLIEEIDNKYPLWVMSKRNEYLALHNQSIINPRLLTTNDHLSFGASDPLYSELQKQEKAINKIRNKEYPRPDIRKIRRK